MQDSAEILFAQKLAANTKETRDKAVRKLRKWLAVRSSSTATSFAEEDMLKLWKGLFYCMWMSDKPVVQEELAKTISEIIHCFGTTDAAFQFIKNFYVTMNREWSRIDYLRIDKYMMFVRVFLNQSFEFVRRLKWNSEAEDQLISILDDAVINPKSEDASLGLQMHIADIYVEELAKVASSELTGRQLTSFFIPYCRLLTDCKEPALRKTVIHRVFEYTMRLCDSDSESGSEDEEGGETEYGGEEESSKGENIQESEDEGENYEEEIGSDEDDDGLKKVYGEYRGEEKFLRQVRRHERESMKLPFPNFDYKDMGDTLLEMASKRNIKIKQKMRNQTYSLVKRFHEMASGVFPLDAVNPSIGRRLRTKDYDAAALRLLQLDEEISEEKRMWKKELWDKRKAKLNGTNIDESEESDDDEDEEASTNQKPPKSKLQVDEVMIGDASSTGKQSNKKTTSSVEAAHQTCSPKTKTSKKRCRPENSSKSTAAIPERSAKKLKIDGSQASSSGRTQGVSTDKLEERLIAKPLDANGVNGFEIDPHTRKANAKKRKKKARAMRLKAAKSARKAKPVESSTDGECGETNSLVNKSAHIRKKIPKSKHEKNNNLLLEREKNLSETLPVTTSDVEKIGKSDEEVTSPAPQSPSEIEFVAQMPLKTPRPEKNQGTFDQAIQSKIIPSMENDKKSELVQVDKKGIGNSDKTVELPDVETEVAALLPDAVAATEDVDHFVSSKISPNSSPKLPTISQPEIEQSDGPEPVPTPKRKVEFVTLWSPTENKSSAECETPMLRRSTRTAKNATPAKKASSTRKVAGRKVVTKSRYYDEVAAMDFDQATAAAENITNTPVAKKSSTSPKASPMVQFEDFVKTPPAFFKVALRKVTPEKSPKSIKLIQEDTPVAEVKEVLRKSTRKVNFSLTKNSSQGMRHYAMSLRNRPGIPYNADNVPAQGVLKASPPVKTDFMPKKRKTVQ